MARKVKVVGVAGYPEGFRAVVIPGLDRVKNVREDEVVAVISTEAGELLVVPADSLEDVA